MKKIFGYILAAAALTPALTSCSDYLEVTDESSVSPDNFPTNMTHVDLLLNSAYAGRPPARTLRLHVVSQVHVSDGPQPGLLRQL